MCGGPRGLPDLLHGVQVCELETAESASSVLTAAGSPSAVGEGSEVVDSPFFIPEVSGVAHPAFDDEGRVQGGSVYRVLGIPASHDAKFQQEQQSHILSWPDAQQVSILQP